MESYTNWIEPQNLNPFLRYVLVLYSGQSWTLKMEGERGGIIGTVGHGGGC